MPYQKMKYFKKENNILDQIIYLKEECIMIDESSS